MKEIDIEDLVKKAKESLKAAKDLLRNGYFDFSASRSYYTMFYIAEAVLLTKSLHFSKHKAVISTFGKEFIKTGIIPSNLHRYIMNAFDIRQAGDYGPLNSVNKEKAKMLIDQAKEFIDTIEAYLKKEGYEL